MPVRYDSRPTPTASDMSNLNERRRSQTCLEIASVAVDLFTRHGYDNTTVEDVARAAGVSRRTAYRHFPLKEDLLFMHGPRWLDAFDKTVANTQPGESTRDLIRRGVLAVADAIEGEREHTLAALAVVAANESLRDSIGRFQNQWVDRYIAMTLKDLGTSQTAQLDAVAIAGALVGTTNTIVGVWAETQPVDMRDLTRAMLERIDPVWPQACR